MVTKRLFPSLLLEEREVRLRLVLNKGELIYLFFSNIGAKEISFYYELTLTDVCFLLRGLTRNG